MSDIGKDDFEDVDQLLSSDDDNDFISAEDSDEAESSHHEPESNELEEEELEEELGDAHEESAHQESLEEDEYEQEYSEHAEPGESTASAHDTEYDDDADEARKKQLQAYAVLGGIGVAALVAGGVVISNFVGGSEPAPSPQPTFGAGSDIPQTEEVPQEHGFGELIGPEANGDPSEAAFAASEDPDIDPFASGSNDLSLDFGDSSDVAAYDEPATDTPESSDSTPAETDLDVASYDDRMGRAMDELAREANLVGSIKLDATISDVRSYVDERFETALQERDEIRDQIRQAREEDERQNKQMAAIERNLEAFKAEIAEAMMVARDRMAKLEARDPAAFAADPVDLNAIEAIGNRTRLPGFKILSTSGDGDLAISKTPTGKVQVFFKGETLFVRGKGPLKVTGVHAEGRVVLVGNDYFFDEVYEKPASPPARPRNTKPKADTSASKQGRHAAVASGSKSSRSPVQTKASNSESKDPGYVISESIPLSANNSGREKTSSFSRGAHIESRASGRVLAEGWKVVGNDVNQNRFLVKSPVGRWHPVKVGQVIPELGEVFGMDENRNLLVGEHIIVNK